MAVVMTMHWSEITPDVYDTVRARARWEEETPDGAVLHAAWFAPDGFHVLDIWQSQGQFERFITDRIMPVVKGELGVKSEPKVEVSPLHRRFVAPGVSGAA